MVRKILFGSLVFLFYACVETGPNLTQDGQDILELNEVFIDDISLDWRDTVYIPIYSDIYSKSKHVRFNLTATLSIRNTSLTDSIFIEDIEYYDTDGALVRNYLERILLLKPLQSIAYVIDEEDNVGGTGANFIVNWGAHHKDVKPIFQGVMISTYRQQGISFITEGKSIKKSVIE